MPTFIVLGNVGLNQDRLIGLKVIDIGGKGDVHHVIAVMSGQVRNSDSQIEFLEAEHTYQKSEHTMLIKKFWSKSDAYVALYDYVAELNK